MGENNNSNFVNNASNNFVRKLQKTSPLESKVREMLSNYSIEQTDVLQKQVRMLLTSDKKMTESLRGQVQRVADIIMRNSNFLIQEQASKKKEKVVNILNNELKEAEKHHGIQGAARNSNSLFWGR